MKGMAQKELAGELGINTSALYHFGTGKHKPSPKVMKKLRPMLAAVEAIRKKDKN